VAYHDADWAHRTRGPPGETFQRWRPDNVCFPHETLAFLFIIISISSNALTQFLPLLMLVNIVMHLDAASLMALPSWGLSRRARITRNRELAERFAQAYAHAARPNWSDDEGSSSGEDYAEWAMGYHDTDENFSDLMQLYGESMAPILRSVGVESTGLCVGVLAAIFSRMQISHSISDEVIRCFLWVISRVILPHSTQWPRSLERLRRSLPPVPFKVCFFFPAAFVDCLAH
jgi:hypothetical protein